MDAKRNIEINKVASKPNLEVFSSSLQELAQFYKDLLVVTSDSRGSGKLVPFGQRFPDQLVEIGIAEQNLVGVSAGLASCGKKVYAVSPACFLTARALEQIKNDVAYSDNPVKLIGISAGVSYGALGSTHHSLHDYAVLRAIHNMTVVAPADNFETEQAIKQSLDLDHPVYIRFGKKNMPHLPSVGKAEFSFGRGRVIRQGKQVALIAAGETVFPAYEAANLLEKNFNISSSVVSMHTIKPLDHDLLNKLSKTHHAIITIEEHSVAGGLGEACASYLMQSGYSKPFHIMGLPDEYTVTGSQVEILEHYGISGLGISTTAYELINGTNGTGGKIY